MTKFSIISWCLLFPILSQQSVSHATPATADDILPIVAQAANSAQKKCYEFMHEDAGEYVSCINALDSALPIRANRNTQSRRLGISYFGWIGANNSARLSLPGADQAARYYLPRFRKLQQQLAITDIDLCATVPGECKSRLAQIKFMEFELKTPTSVSRK